MSTVDVEVSTNKHGNKVYEVNGRPYHDLIDLYEQVLYVHGIYLDFQEEEEGGSTVRRKD